MHYWGPYNQIDLLKDIPNKVILSPADFLYINEGFWFIWGNPFGTYKPWDVVYSFNPLPPGWDKDRILGAEATLCILICRIEIFLNNKLLFYIFINILVFILRG